MSEHLFTETVPLQRRNSSPVYSQGFADDSGETCFLAACMPISVFCSEDEKLVRHNFWWVHAADLAFICCNLAKCSAQLYLIKGEKQICIRQCGAVMGYGVSDKKEFCPKFRIF